MMKTRIDDIYTPLLPDQEEEDEISFIESSNTIMLIEYWSNYIEK